MPSEPKDVKPPEASRKRRGGQKKKRRSKEYLEQMQQIVAVFLDHGENVKQTSKALGMPVTTLRQFVNRPKWMKEIERQRGFKEWEREVSAGQPVKEAIGGIPVPAEYLEAFLRAPTPIEGRIISLRLQDFTPTAVVQFGREDLDKVHLGDVELFYHISQEISATGTKEDSTL